MTAGDPARLQLHGTAVAIEGQGVLLRGPAGAGKSSMALRLMAEGAVLIADDLVAIRRDGKTLTIDLPAAVDNRFRGAIERRGSGIENHLCFGPAPLVLVADLRPGSKDWAENRAEFLGLPCRLVVLDPFQPRVVRSLRRMALVGLVD
jgi:HPr kinase/phosphorylase